MSPSDRRPQRGIPRGPRTGTRLFTGILCLAALCLASFCVAGPTLAGDDLSALDARFAEAEEEIGARKAFEQFLPEYEAFAAAHTGTEEGLGAELWLLRMKWYRRAEGTMHEEARTLARRLVETYPESDQLKRIPEFSYLYSAEDFAALCTTLIEVSPHAPVKAECLFQLGRSEMRDDAAAGRKSMERLRADYGELRWRAITYEEIATAYLEPHGEAKLAVGEVAPDIDGVGIDGRPMKLSDHRGKVVVLDFWGDW